MGKTVEKPNPPPQPRDNPPGPDPGDVPTKPVIHGHGNIVRHCAPQADQIFVEALNRVLSRLRTLFGTEPSQAEGTAFLLANGWNIDFWVLTPDSDCSEQHCYGTVTLCGRCHDQHILSDFLYGFVAGYFDLTEAHVDFGGWTYQILKWAANKFEGPSVAPEHYSQARPAYHAGVQLGQACRDAPHTHKWDININDLCRGTTGEELGAISIRTDCIASDCINRKADADKDWSVKHWNWIMPVDYLQRWAITGEKQ